MFGSPRNILILFIVILATRIPQGAAQTPPQLSLRLVGQTSGEYVAPAGQTTELKVEILNSMHSDVYLVEGYAYLDPNLNGTWWLAHSDGLGGFHLSYLQSAIWSFDLAVPANIQAINATNGVPQVVLLIQVAYAATSVKQLQQLAEFTLSVPGATLRQPINTFWLIFGGIVAVICVGAVYGRARRRRPR